MRSKSEQSTHYRAIITSYSFSRHACTNLPLSPSMLTSTLMVRTVYLLFPLPWSKMLTSAPIGARKCNSRPFIGNGNTQTDWLTDRQQVDLKPLRGIEYVVPAITQYCVPKWLNLIITYNKSVCSSFYLKNFQLPSWPFVARVWYSLYFLLPPSSPFDSNHVTEYLPE